MHSILQSRVTTIDHLTQEITADRVGRIALLRAEIVRVRGLAATSRTDFRQQLLCLAHAIERHVFVLETTSGKRTRDKE
jgi:hypothetical protein